MCGIVGFSGLGTKQDLNLMLNSIKHRGPDDQGVFIDLKQRIFFGHCRLSILDIDHGHQPMWNHDFSICVIFNGEIYNHIELRHVLIRRGYIFKTDHSDTEVLIHGYKEWGQELPKKLNGMFAFAIYDKNNQLLFLARDRFGEKPLYYSKQHDFFGFSSELKSFKYHKFFKKGINQKSLQKFFAYGYIPAPYAFYSDCYKLPAGHHLTYSLVSQTYDVKCYWDFKLEKCNNFNYNEAELEEELLSLLSQSVKRRLISDVPLGVFLSGGIDSSGILALASLNSGKVMQTFTIGFNNSSFDESSYAHYVSKIFDSRHHHRVLDFNKMNELLSFVLSRLDEPIADPSILPTYLLSSFARESVKVALSGDGGDELFAGYDPFKALRIAQLYKKYIPKKIHNILLGLSSILPISHNNMSFDFKVRRGLTGMSYLQELWNPVWMGPVEPNNMRLLFEEPLDKEELYEESIKLWKGSNSNIIDKTLEFYTNVYLKNNILTKTDRASMMSSLETRAIFLDNDLVEFCKKIPYSLKYYHGKQKYILKKALNSLLPDKIIHRKKKGFGIPLLEWLQRIPEDAYLSPIEGMNLDYIKKSWQEHKKGVADHRFLLWSWLCLQHMVD